MNYALPADLRGLEQEYEKVSKEKDAAIKLQEAEEAVKLREEEERLKKMSKRE